MRSRIPPERAIAISRSSLKCIWAKIITLKTLSFSTAKQCFSSIYAYNTTASLERRNYN